LPQGLPKPVSTLAPEALIIVQVIVPPAQSSFVDVEYVTPTVAPCWPIITFWGVGPTVEVRERHRYLTESALA
jgi:hypothetical protein